MVSSINRDTGTHQPTPTCQASPGPAHVLVSSVGRSFSTNSRPALRAAAEAAILGRHNPWPYRHAPLEETEFGVEQITSGRALGQTDGGRPDRVAVKQNWMTGARLARDLPATMPVFAACADLSPRGVEPVYPPEYGRTAGDAWGSEATARPRHASGQERRSFWPRAPDGQQPAVVTTGEPPKNRGGS